jgi:hypothetical protein
MKATAPQIEPLESRIAPAVIVAYTDIDGDIVRIVDSSNTLTLAALTLSGGAAGQLQELDLTAPGFAGADISFSIVRRPGGDGLAHVGFIDATGNDLGKVGVRGDLGRIVSGDATTSTQGLEALAVHSIGGRGLTTQDVGGTLSSIVTGGVGKISVRGSVLEANLAISGALGALGIGGGLVGGSDAASGTIVVQGAIGNVSLGSIIGGSGDDSGWLSSVTAIGNVSVKRNIVGGPGDRSGGIDSGGTLGRVRIGINLVGGAGDESGGIFADGAAANLAVFGSVIGGSGTDAGAIRAASLSDIFIRGDLLGREGLNSGRISSTAGAIGHVRIGADVDGGEGTASGSIDSATTLGSVAIGRGLIGGGGPASGRIRSDGDMGNVTIGGDVRGGSADGAGQLLSDTGNIGRVKLGGWLVGGSVSAAGTLTDTGVIRAGGDIASVSMGGSLFAGSAANTGILVRSGAVIAGDVLGPVSVGGSLLGNATNPVRIVGHGGVPVAGSEDVAISSVRVRGDAVYAEILAGFTFNLDEENADASIGGVSIGGGWIASSIVAGAEDLGAAGYGIGDALQVVSDDPLLIARIAAISIAGAVRGTAGLTTDHFGFVAQQVSSLRIGGVAVALTAGAGNDDRLIAGANDVRLLEV